MRDEQQPGDDDVRPSIAKIVWNDWVALVAAIGVPGACLHFAFGI